MADKLAGTNSSNHALRAFQPAGADSYEIHTVNVHATAVACVAVRP
jgi:hypothetical protein